MKILKMEKRFFDMIKSSEKRWEFRKLEKGYTRGKYKVVDLKNKNNTLGYIKLYPYGINPPVYKNYHGEAKAIVDGAKVYLDQQTYEFVHNNYVGRKIDFIAYSVKVVEEGDE